MEEFLMSRKERERECVFEAVKSNSINLKKAAQLLTLSYSQIKRLWKNYKSYGPISLVSKKRGKKSNRAVSEEIKKEIVKIIADEFYGCKPLYVSEKLEEFYQIKFSSEFIRQLMIEHQLWFLKKRKHALHQRRQRRSCEGELVQIDASQHDWFEGRLVQNGHARKAHLHIFIDDATSKIYGAYFDYEETTNGYFHAAKKYFKKHGLPKNVYCDKRGTFVVNSGENRGQTQFARAMEELNIEIIIAHSPEAKGRVERAFGILQDRLVWEMRHLNISTLEDANDFLSQYLELHNNKFGKKPACSFDAHHSLEHDQDLKYTLCKKEKRVLSKNLEIQYNNNVYQMEIPKKQKKPVRKSKIDVITTLEEELQFEYKGEFLEYKKYEDQPFEEQQMELQKIKKTRYKPSKNHPWRNFNLSVKRAASVVMSTISMFC